jgi:hypothetical protein
MIVSHVSLNTNRLSYLFDPFRQSPDTDFELHRTDTVAETGSVRTSPDNIILDFGFNCTSASIFKLIMFVRHMFNHYFTELGCQIYIVHSLCFNKDSTLCFSLHL